MNDRLDKIEKHMGTGDLKPAPGDKMPPLPDKDRKPEETGDKGGPPPGTKLTSVDVDNLDKLTADEINENWDAVKTALKSNQ